MDPTDIEHACLNLYRELALNPSTSLIRVVDILPAKREISCDYRYRTLDDETELDTIELELRTIDLDVDPNPEYEALSYTWGDPKATQRVQLNGLDYTVTSSLHAALRHLRLRTQTRTFWIDAICINQKDNQEKSREVQRMRDIYSKARSMTIWLGDYEQLSKEAVDKCFKYCWKASKAADHLQIDEALGWMNEDEQKSRIYEPLEQLLARPWFERIWIVQEVAVRQHGDDGDESTIFMCGASIIPYTILTKAHDMLRSHLDDDRSHLGHNLLQYSNIASIDSIRKLFWSAKEDKKFMTPAQALLQALRCTSGKFKATDPRDRVYGLLGLINFSGNNELPPNIRPDYTLSAAQVLLRAGCYISQNITGERDLSEHVPRDEVTVYNPLCTNYLDMVDPTMNFHPGYDTFDANATHYGDVIWTSRNICLPGPPETEEDMFGMFEQQMRNIWQQSDRFVQNHPRFQGRRVVHISWAFTIYFHLLKHFRCKDTEISRGLKRALGGLDLSLSPDDFGNSLFIWLIFSISAGLRTVFITDLGFMGCCEGVFVPKGAKVCRFFKGPPGRPYVLLVKHDDTRLRIAYDVHRLMHLDADHDEQRTGLDGKPFDEKQIRVTIFWKPKELEMIKRYLTKPTEIETSEKFETVNEFKNMSVFAASSNLETAQMFSLRKAAGYEKVYGPDHEKTLHKVHYLGQIYEAAGKLDLAQKMYQWTYEGFELIKGREHPATIEIAGSLLKTQHRYPEAEEKFREALLGYEREFGADHALTAGVADKLGALFMSAGKLDEAIHLTQRAIQGYEKKLDLNEPPIANAIIRLGMLYEKHTYALLEQEPERARILIEHQIGLCQRYLGWKTPLLIILSKMLVWIGSNTLAVLAYSYAEPSKSRMFSVSCDGCDCEIRGPNGRHICRTCKAVDLCDSCLRRYESGILNLSECAGHLFVEVWELFSIDDVFKGSEDVSSLDEWLADLARNLTDGEIVY